MSARRAPAAIIGPDAFSGDLDLGCDVVVVGSGAGGATAAATLAEAGLDVVCLEEGGHYDTDDYGADIPETMSKVLRNGGATMILGRAPVPYLEGRCVGGSTVVNGGMCWRTPERILDEWVGRGLNELAPARLDPYFDEVERTINARYQDPGSEGSNNEVFHRGATALGWRLSRNKRAQEHCVGSNDCLTGCPTGAKQTTVNTWLPRFYAGGGVLYTHAKVARILFEKGRAAGVTGTLGDAGERRRFRVRARAVVVAGGAVETPILLLRNKLGRVNGQIGRHFTIHPNIKICGLFDHEVDTLRGTHQAWQCTEFEKEGILLAPGNLPLLFQTLSFNDFGVRLAQKMRDHRFVATGGMLVDDHASGRISLLPFGLPLVRYDVTDVDQGRFVKGAALMAELYFAAGAREVYLPFHHDPVLRSADDIRRLFARPPRVEDTEYFTAHLMGTCRMDTDPRRGAVDPDGQVWGAPGLYVADASIMPGTIGVNPQVTIMALARLVAEKLGDRLSSRRAVA